MTYRKRTFNVIYTGSLVNVDRQLILLLIIPSTVIVIVKYNYKFAKCK